MKVSTLSDCNLDKFGLKIGFVAVAIASFITMILYSLMKPEKAKKQI